MESAKEIFKRHIDKLAETDLTTCTFDENESLAPEQIKVAIEAMEEYAKQQAISFRRWIQYYENKALEGQFLYGKTTEELYDMFLNQSTENEKTNRK